MRSLAIKLLTFKGNRFLLLRIFIRFFSFLDNLETLQRLRSTDQLALKLKEDRIQRIKDEFQYPKDEKDTEIKELKVNQNMCFLLISF